MATRKPWITHLVVAVLALGVGLALGCVTHDPSVGRDEVAELAAYHVPWLRDAPYTPAFAVLDTESSLGPYATTPKRIEVVDLVRMHGHACDGLVVAACALKLGLDRLYPDGVVDRTDTGCVTNNSPCFGDAAAYLTGGRVRFGTQRVDPSLGAVFVVQRLSTGHTVRVELAPGRFPEPLRALEARLRAGDADEALVRECQAAQWAFARALVERPLDESFTVVDLGSGQPWTPDPYPHLSPRGDVLLKELGRQR